MSKKIYRYVSTILLVFTIGSVFYSSNRYTCLSPEVFSLFDALKFSLFILITYILGAMSKAEAKTRPKKKAYTPTGAQGHEEFWLDKYASQTGKVEVNL